ncbi:MmgE/PrpD family protein [Pseudorhodoferax sp.]|uniref:MmgE/PrpD family protein n=1 Tax=Pseudorhodoferax sp. TaxID=1993553 RepID=UPI0039E30109
MTLYEHAPSEDPMAALCRMALGVRYEQLPAEVIRHAKHSLLDAMAVTIGGSGMEGVPGIAALVKEKGGKEETLLPFYGGRVPASEAALAIGPMPRAMDCGELHEEAGHIGEYIVASLLAATGLKPRVSGQEFLAAMVVGQETIIRIGMAYRLISQAVKAGDCGGHYIFGAVAAVGRLMGLSQDELENAQGIARTMTQPHTMAIYSPATLMVRVHHGLVCQAAITACQLARKGITGPRQQVLLGAMGYLSRARWDTRPDALTERLGQRWEMENVIAKGYCACYFSHSSIDGILDQMRSHGFEAGDIASIHLEVSSPGWKATCEPRDKKWNPQTVPECQFSLAYAVAIAALDKEVFLNAYTAQSRARHDVRDLMSRITATEVPSLPEWGARVSTRLRDGRAFTNDIVYVKGHPSNPFSEQDFIDKFRRCVPWSACPLSEPVVDGLIHDILNLEHIEDAAQALLLPLTPQDGPGT